MGIPRYSGEPIGSSNRFDIPPGERLEDHIPCFFLACLLGSIIGLVQAIAEKHRTLADFEKAALYSLFWIGFFGAFDSFFYD